LGNREGRHILSGHRTGTQHCVASNPRVLVHASHAAKDRMVLHDHMACKGDRIRKNTVLPNAGIVAHVGTSHKEIVASDLGHSPTVLRTPAHRHKFSKNISGPDLEPRGSPGILEILRIPTDDRVRVNLAALTDDALAVDHRMWPNHNPILKRHARSNHGVGTNFYVP